MTKNRFILSTIETEPNNTFILNEYKRINVIEFESGV